MPEISVIVPARNAEDTVEALLTALSRQDVDVAFDVILVDNGSSDRTAELAERSALGPAVIRRSHGWPGEARNLGAAAAASPRLAFTDADCRPEPGWLRAGLAGLEANDLVQGAVSPDPSIRQGPFDRTLSVSGLALFETANMFVRRELFERLGGFEDWLPADVGRPFGEDVWFGWRAIRSGARVEFADAAIVHHAVFERAPRDYIAERRRLYLFPALAARIPELREGFFYRRYFLSMRSARFALAVIAVLGCAALIATPRTWPAWAPALLAVPYLRLWLAEAWEWRRRAVRVALVRLAADTVGFVSLLRGSLRWRAPLI